MCLAIIKSQSHQLNKVQLNTDNDSVNPRPLSKINYSEILVEHHSFSFKKMHLKMSGKWQPSCVGLNVLTLVVLKLWYFWITRSIPRLLMPWWHQQTLYWQQDKQVLVFHLEGFQPAVHLSVEKWEKMQVCIYFLTISTAWQGLKWHRLITWPQ